MQKEIKKSKCKTRYYKTPRGKHWQNILWHKNLLIFPKAKETKAKNQQKRLRAQERKSWNIYKKWQGENIEKIRPGQEIRTLEEFRAIYNDESVGRRIAKIKYEVQYQVSGKTFRTLKKRYMQEMEDEEGWSFDPTMFNRAMSTQELAAQIQDSIYAYRDQLLADDPSMSKKELRLKVSQYFFGS